MKNNKFGFTLVELLAVIVILAIILVIAVPKVMSIIEDSKKAILEASARQILQYAENQYLENKTMGINENITCNDIAKINNEDYERCIIEFDNSGKAKVTIKGSGKFDNLNICAGDKTNIVATNNACEVEYTKASTYIEKLEAFTDDNGLITDTTTDKNIRYVGATPNNKVYFNCKDKDASDVVYGETNYDYAASCEVWRIIGLFEVDNGSGKIEKRVKIVREALTDNSGNVIKMSFDSSVGGENIENSINYGYGINEWGESTYEDGSVYEGADLMRMLNGYYIGKDATCTYCNGTNQGTCENSCTSSVTSLSSTSLSMVESVLWKRGAQKSGFTVSAITMYNGERGNISAKICVSSSTHDGKALCTDTVNRSTEWTGLVGLIYPSDYGYASTDTSCASDILGEDSTCENNNWLHPDDWYWTFLPRELTTHATNLWLIQPNHSALTGNAYDTGGVRPSLYLSSSVQITGGDGNMTPFKLAI